MMTIRRMIKQHLGRYALLCFPLTVISLLVAALCPAAIMALGRSRLDANKSPAEAGLSYR